MPGDARIRGGTLRAECEGRGTIEDWFLGLRETRGRCGGLGGWFDVVREWRKRREELAFADVGFVLFLRVVYVISLFVHVVYTLQTCNLISYSSYRIIALLANLIQLP
jgi:hypothetical protein